MAETKHVTVHSVREGFRDVGATAALLVAIITLWTVFRPTSADISIRAEGPTPSLDQYRAYATNTGTEPGALELDGRMEAGEELCAVRFRVGAGGSMNDLTINAGDMAVFIVESAEFGQQPACHYHDRWMNCELTYWFRYGDVREERQVPFPCAGAGGN